MPGEIHHLIALDLNVRGLSEVKKRTTTSVTVIKQLVTQALKLGLEVSRIERDIDGINGDDALWERMHALLTETEIGDAVIMLACWQGTGRALKALGIGSVCVVPPSSETIASLRNDQLSERTELAAAE